MTTLDNANDGCGGVDDDDDDDDNDDCNCGCHCHAIFYRGVRI